MNPILFAKNRVQIGILFSALFEYCSLCIQQYLPDYPDRFYSLIILMIFSSFPLTVNFTK